MLFLRRRRGLYTLRIRYGWGALLSVDKAQHYWQKGFCLQHSRFCCCVFPRGKTRDGYWPLRYWLRKVTSWAHMAEMRASEIVGKVWS